MEKTVSVIVPVFNTQDYVSGCVESIIKQTYNNLQIILVDDGSTDRSGELCDHFSTVDNRITVIHKKNGGLSSARNAGLKIATGKYVMFVDGDDYITENAVEILVNTASVSNVDIVQFSYKETNLPYKNLYAGFNGDINVMYDTKDFFDYLYKFGGVAASACTKFYKRSLFNNLSFEEGIIHEDEQLLTFLLQKVSSVAYINATFYYYVMRPSSIMKSNFSKSNLDFFYVSETRLQQLLNLKYYDLVEYEKTRYIATAIDFWCKAKRCNDIESLKIIEEKIKCFKPEKLNLNLKHKTLYMFAKANVKFLNIYYLYKLIRGQI